MNVNEKLSHKSFLKNAQPIHFAGLSNYLDLFQERLLQVLQKTSSPDLGDIHHCNCKFTKVGLGASMNSIFMPSGRAVHFPENFFITTAQLHSTKPELRFCTGSNPACGCQRFAMVRISDNGPGWK